MAKTKNTNAKADIDFEQELWNVANELRGAVAENQYEDYCIVASICEAYFREV